MIGRKVHSKTTKKKRDPDEGLLLNKEFVQMIKKRAKMPCKLLTSEEVWRACIIKMI